MTLPLRRLEIALSRLSGFSEPKPALEQVITPGPIAARMLHLAIKDISLKRVCDLGCGTGVLAIGAALLGARHVVGVDIDKGALVIAKKNLEKCISEKGLPVEFVHSPVCDFVNTGEPFDTVIQNPPYGAQKQQLHADRAFLKKATELAKKRIYSLHQAQTRMFIKEFIRSLAGGCWEDDVVGTFDYALPNTFKFHTRETITLKVDLHKITNVDCDNDDEN